MRDEARVPAPSEDHILMLGEVGKYVLLARKTAKDGGADKALLSFLDTLLLAIGDRIYKATRQKNG